MWAARSDGPAGEWIDQLAQSGRLVPVGLKGETRYVLAEHAPAYHAAFDLEEWKNGRLEEWKDAGAQDRDDASRTILRRALTTHGPLTNDWLLARYPFEPGWLDATLAALVDEGTIVYGQITAQSTTLPINQYCE